MSQTIFKNYMAEETPDVIKDNIPYVDSRISINPKQ